MRKRARIAIPKTEAKIRGLQAQLDIIQNLRDEERTEDDMLTAALLQTRITELERERALHMQTSATARYRVEGETISKYWSKISKERAPRDVIYALQELNPDDPGNPNLVTRTDDMANLARTYHVMLQEDDETPQEVAQRLAATEEVLDSVDKTLSEEAHNALDCVVDRGDVQIALRLSDNGKATGVDGLPCELWKTIDQRYKQKSKMKERTFDIVGTLTKVYNDVQLNGVDKSTDFTRGWMCPIHKKNSKQNIANYRPITILNTMYKIFTKALTMGLAKHAPSIIHPNQAGFMQERSIFDQIRLSQLMLHYAEITEQNGLMVVLDQEKAYDKINHEYLWKVLKCFNLSETFINTVKALYEDATTVVMINGVASTPFRVTRSVRQGDPLSCLLFDLAIKPLACMLRKSDLRGYNVPGVVDKIIVTLFADDTMTYLSEFDNYHTLLSILDKWCLVSRAKFNKEKTEAIPMGTQEYRERVLQTRRLTPNSRELPNDLSLTAEGSSIRSLGAWIGNGADQMAPWTAVTKKVNAALTRWGRCNPTLRGKRLIVQMIVAGMTQYLTKAQGMPTEVENRLIRITQNFIWNDARTSPVSMETLSLPIREGGIKLIDMKARNEAVELTWLRGYLNNTKNRPTWAYVADVLICDSVMSVDRNTIQEARINPYLQTWHASTHSMSRLPNVLKTMLKVARKHNTDFQAIKLTRALKKKMPTWYHRGAINPSRRLLHKAECDCLRDTHDVRTIADLVKIIKRGEDPQVRHSNRWNCACPYCRSDRTDKGCDNPNKCYKAARSILENMSPKWHHGYEPPNDNLTLTERRRDRNHRAHKTNGKIVFNPSVTTKDCLSDGFRVFTDPEVQDHSPAHRQARGVEVEDEAVTVYTDGSCLFNGDDDAKAGSGVWFGEDDPRNISCRVPRAHQSNQAGEIFAIHKAAEATLPFAPLHIISDSKYAIEGLTKHLEKWQNEGWLDVANAKLFKAAAYQLQKRSARTSFEWTKGHNNNEGNEGADELAGEGARGDENNKDTLEIPHQWSVTGTKIASLTQALAYKRIRESQNKRTRRVADTSLDMARHCVRDSLGGQKPTDATIWHGIRHKDISRNISDFLWRATHQSQRVGKYWRHIPGYEQRAICPLCEEEESMEHILIDCTSPERRVIWTLAEKAWRKKYDLWPPVHMGTIIGASLAKFTDAEGKQLPGSARLYRILMTESAHLIWKIRCERRIQRTDIEGDTHSQTEISKRWFAAMNTRLRIDCEMTHAKYGKRKLDNSTVERTWSGLLKDEKDLPPAWATPGFLVGMGPL